MITYILSDAPLPAGTRHDMLVGGKLRLTWGGGGQRLWRADGMAQAHSLPFGALLRRKRLERGLTQEALAERAG